MRARPPACRASRPSCRGRRGTSAAAPSPGKPSPFRFTLPLLLRRRRSSSTPTRTSGRRCTTNKEVGVMWPNDADGNAIRGALGPLLEEGRLQDRRPGRLHGRDERLLGADHQVQAGRDPDLQHVPDPARLRDVLAAGRPAGADEAGKIAQIAKTGMFASQVSSLGKLGVQPRQRRLLGPDLAVPLVAHRDHEQGARRRLHEGRAASSGTSRWARASRSSTSASPRSRRAATRRTRPRSRTR